MSPTNCEDRITLSLSLSFSLSSLLLKVCQTLKNRSRDVRDVGRTTLIKMAASLGPKYLKYIIKEMKESLTRGYMVRNKNFYLVHTHTHTHTHTHHCLCLF